jgi:hypothetical protein
MLTQTKTQNQENRKSKIPRQIPATSALDRATDDHPNTGRPDAGVGQAESDRANDENARSATYGG